jgi:hypothetical protein
MIFGFVVVNGVTIYFIKQPLPTSGEWYIWNGEIVLSEGDTVGSVFNGVTAGDDLYMTYHAVRIDIDQ